MAPELNGPRGYHFEARGISVSALVLGLKSHGGVLFFAQPMCDRCAIGLLPHVTTSNLKQGRGGPPATAALAASVSLSPSHMCEAG